jgi:adenosyl cobinamide kinase/adenosyl cobinamide phosphate guanylyltransferase
MPYVFVIGGASSGKSRFALDWFRGRTGVAFVATGIPTDPEMEERIRAHRRDRPSCWKTVEAPLDLADAVREAAPGSEGLIVDCLTFWVSNLMYAKHLDDEEIRRIAEETALLVRDAAPESLVVTNEVGLGVIPHTAEGRRFRKIAGEVNQIFARHAGRAYFLLAGVATRIK